MTARVTVHRCKRGFLASRCDTAHYGEEGERFAFDYIEDLTTWLHQVLPNVDPVRPDREAVPAVVSEVAAVKDSIPYKMLEMAKTGERLYLADSIETNIARAIAQATDARNGSNPGLRLVYLTNAVVRLIHAALRIELGEGAANG